VVAGLERRAAAERGRPLFDRRTTRLHVLTSDLVEARSWRRRARLLREHLFPPRAYMRQAYAGCPAALLPLAYIARIVRGAPTWLRRAQDM
jgi:hypothetical protein